MGTSIVIMGGSFNPPTIAHLNTMKMAINAVNAEKGFFVPVSFAYLKRKMTKAFQSHMCLSDDMRIRMLEAMIDNNDKIDIYLGEINEPFAINIETMQYMQERYPDATICFVAGADKIELIELFQRKWGFLDKYCAIVFARDGIQLKHEIASRELLCSHQSSIVFVNPPEENTRISSTKIRKYLFEIDKVAEMLHPDVIPLLKKLKPEDYPEEILKFKDEYAFLSNEYPADVIYEGITYSCATSAFLASKTDNQEERKAIARMNADKAKQKYSTKPGDSKWEEHQRIIMETIIHLKFQQHPDLAEKLVATGERKLINGSKKDKFWGVNLTTWEGENHLGLILMKERERQE